MITKLRRTHGAPARPVSRNPFHLILFEQVGYLVPDQQRSAAFRALRTSIGLKPADILRAPVEALTAAARLGGAIAARLRGTRMRESAELVLGHWAGKLESALDLPLPKARRALAAFPMIGEPGADRILVLAGRARLLPLDSNALRVLTRLGLVTEGRSYRDSYRRAQDALAPSLPADHDWLIEASSLLRTHGQEVCKRTTPLCERCPLRDTCPSAS